MTSYLLVLGLHVAVGQVGSLEYFGRVLQVGQQRLCNNPIERTCVNEHGAIDRPVSHSFDFSSWGVALGVIAFATSSSSVT